MINIIKTNIQGAETNSVNTRDIHTYLGIRKDYNAWAKSQIARLNLSENTDYILLTQEVGQTKRSGSGGHNRKDYIVTLDAAKNIGLISFTPKAKKYVTTSSKRRRNSPNPRQQAIRFSMR